MKFDLNKITTLLVFIVTLVFGVLAIGADLPQRDAKLEASKLAADKPAAVASNQQEQYLLQKVNAQFEELKEQNSLLKEFKTFLSEIVIWTLSTTVAVLLVIAGGTWFTNFKVFEGEQRRLKEELDASQKVMREEFAANLLEATSNFESRLASSESAMTKMINQSLEGNSLRQARDIDLLRENLQKYIDEIKKQIVLLNEKAKLLQDTDKINWKLIHQAESSLRQVEEHVWELKGNLHNILITQSQGLDSAMRAEDAHTVRIVLSRMKSTINKMLAANDEIDEGMREMIDDSIAKAEKAEPIMASEARALLKKIRTEQGA